MLQAGITNLSTARYSLILYTDTYSASSNCKQHRRCAESRPRAARRGEGRAGDMPAETRFAVLYNMPH